MMRSRFGLRAIGLCLALAGLMAVGAGSAQAEVGAKWLVGGVAVTNALKAELAGEFEEFNPPTNTTKEGMLLGTIGGKGIHILCTGVTFVTGSGSLLIEGGVLGKVRFSGCKILRLITVGGATELLNPCEPFVKNAEGKVEAGIIITELGKGLLSLHKLENGTVDTITVIEPENAKGEKTAIFTTITTSPECAFGEQIKIGGTLAIIDTEVGVSKVTHLIKEFAPLTKLFINGNEANKATIDGSANVKLTGAHNGLSWSGDPA